MLTREQADAIEAEMRALESDPATSIEQMRLFMQSPMPCGHAVGNLLTCPTPPFGCAVCIGGWSARDAGQLGGIVTATEMTPEARKRRAQIAARARWSPAAVTTKEQP